MTVPPNQGEWWVAAPDLHDEPDRRSSITQFQVVPLSRAVEAEERAEKERLAFEQMKRFREECERQYQARTEEVIAAEAESARLREGLRELATKLESSQGMIARSTVAENVRSLLTTQPESTE